MLLESHDAFLEVNKGITQVKLDNPQLATSKFALFKGETVFLRLSSATTLKLAVNVEMDFCH